MALLLTAEDLGFTETLALIRLIGTGALWSRSGRKPFGAFQQPKLSVFGPYTAYGPIRTGPHGDLTLGQIGHILIPKRGPTSLSNGGQICSVRSGRPSRAVVVS